MNKLYVLSEKTRIYRVLSAAVLTFMTVFMLAFGSRQSYGFDELFSIGMIHEKSVIEVCKLMVDDSCPPLFTLLLSLFYRVMPYGETYLLILPILFTVGGVIALGKAGKAIGGEDLGFFAVCVAATSSILITQGGWEIRAYSSLFCFSSMTLLYYVRRLKEESNKNILLYGISLALLLYSHYFGSILALFYGLVDLCLWLRKKIAFKCILSYVWAGICFVPWFIFMFAYHTSDLSFFWVSPPNIMAPVETIAYLLSNSIIYCLLFSVGFLALLFKELQKIKRKNGDDVFDIWRYLMGSIAWLILSVWCYSKFLHPSGGFYLNRYFFVILPHVFLITAYAVCTICRVPWFNQNASRKFLLCISVFALFFVTGYKNYSKILSPENSVTFREVAEYLNDKNLLNDSLLLSTLPEKVVSGWITYYFDKRGYKLPLNIVHRSNGMIASNYRIYNPHELYVGYSDGKKTIDFQYQGYGYDYMNLDESQFLTEDRLLHYKKIYLFDQEGILSNEFLNLIEKTYVLEETFSRSPSERWSFNQKMKALLGFGSTQPDRSLERGLRIYTK
ncbi:MAG: glycosyltransferase family 39 protein [Synergistaceae bacterium]|jgi:uncharacterized membrane protein|nr:glycosyltransferase family 39 protein [Synergistaceae bacterium]